MNICNCCPPVFPSDESNNEDEDCGTSSSTGGMKTMKWKWYKKMQRLKSDLHPSTSTGEQWRQSWSTISVGRAAPPWVHGGVLLPPRWGRQGPLHLRERRQIHRVKPLWYPNVRQTFRLISWHLQVQSNWHDGPPDLQFLPSCWPDKTTSYLEYRKQVLFLFLFCSLSPKLLDTWFVMVFELAEA